MGQRRRVEARGHPQSDDERAIKALIDEFNEKQAAKFEEDLFKQAQAPGRRRAHPADQADEEGAGPPAHRHRQGQAVDGPARRPETRGSAAAGIRCPALLRLTNADRATNDRSGDQQHGRHGCSSGPSTRPFRSCVQGNAGRSSGPHEALRTGLEIGSRFGSQIKTQAGRGFALDAFSDFPQIASFRGTETTTPTKLSACRR